jgi:hypothetical protein
VLSDDTIKQNLSPNARRVRGWGATPLPRVVVSLQRDMMVVCVVFQRYQCCSSEVLIVLLLFRGKHKAIYIYNEKNKLISNQLGSSYRYLGINSDGSAWFLICTSLISQHSPSGSLCWQGDSGIAQSSQASVKPLKTFVGK